MALHRLCICRVDASCRTSMHRNISRQTRRDGTAFVTTNHFYDVIYEPADDAMRIRTAFLRLTPQTRHDALLGWRMAVVWVIASMGIPVTRSIKILSISLWRRSLILWRLLLTALLCSFFPGSFDGVRTGIQLTRTYHQQDVCQVISG